MTSFGEENDVSNWAVAVALLLGPSILHGELVGIYDSVVAPDGVLLDRALGAHIVAEAVAHLDEIDVVVLHDAVSEVDEAVVAADRHVVERAVVAVILFAAPAVVSLAHALVGHHAVVEVDHAVVVAHEPGEVGGANAGGVDVVGPVECHGHILVGRNAGVVVGVVMGAAAGVEACAVPGAAAAVLAERIARSLQS